MKIGRHTITFGNWEGTPNGKPFCVRYITYRARVRILWAYPFCVVSAL
jgi:hypothetical protein